jgi:LAO/AO transport system kinase
MDVKDILGGDKRAIARLMSKVEDEEPGGLDLLQKIHKHTGRAHIVGFTGSPGVGKSTVVYKVAAALRERGKRIGIVAVDPTSPFTGGALLGDRIRMMELSTDPEVFIRSMGTRGHLGGLARRTSEMAKILDAWGADYVMVETVGTGQAEVDVIQTAQTCVLIMVSGLGDEVQTFKAGILEIGDVFVINKADREGADRLLLELEAMLDLKEEKWDWRPRIVKTVATEGTGVEQLLEAMDEHLAHQKKTGAIHKKNLERAVVEIEDILKDRIVGGFMTPDRRAMLEELAKKVADRQMDPVTAAEKLMK